MLRPLVAVSLLVPFLVGCSNVTGTWISKGATETPTNPIGRVTFAGDGTFTAEADYGQGGKRAMSGTYSYDMMKGKLDLEADGQKREYDVSIKGDEMTISKSAAAAASGTKPAGKSAAATPPHKFTMTRMPGKSMWKM
jgi:hypothetical protein